MGAYSELQQAEFAAEAEGFTAVRHQREVGVGYFDAVATAAGGGQSSTTALAPQHGGRAVPRRCAGGGGRDPPARAGEVRTDHQGSGPARQPGRSHHRHHHTKTERNLHMTDTYDDGLVHSHNWSEPLAAGGAKPQTAEIAAATPASTERPRRRAGPQPRLGAELSRVSEAERFESLTPADDKRPPAGEASRFARCKNSKIVRQAAAGVALTRTAADRPGQPPPRHRHPAPGRPPAPPAAAPPPAPSGCRSRPGPPSRRTPAPPRPRSRGSGPA